MHSPIHPKINAICIETRDLIFDLQKYLIKEDPEEYRYTFLGKKKHACN